MGRPMAGVHPVRAVQRVDQLLGQIRGHRRTLRSDIPECSRSGHDAALQREHLKESMLAREPQRLSDLRERCEVLVD